MKTIRNGLFETNSSSCHSITIADEGGLKDTLPLDKNNICHVFPGDFGTRGKEYNDAVTKAAYAYTFASNYSGKASKRYMDMMRGVIKDHTGAKAVKFVGFKGGYCPDGYIDHQSTDVCEEAFATEGKLKRFIFNRRSVLRIEHDNYCD